jgi:hypothetical protein
MPIHDWKKAYPGLFHHFHQRWISAIGDRLNSGGLPAGYYALAEQHAAGPFPDILTLERGDEWNNADKGGAVLVETPPRTWLHSRAEVDGYAARADRLAVHHTLGDVVAVIEIISPGNKSNKEKLRQFVKKIVDFIRHGVHVLLVDLFPPSKRDPQGIHKLIWDRFLDEPFVLPPGKPLTLAAYSAGEAKAAYVEPVAVGDVLPDMPLFLEPDRHLPIPLEASYQETWDKCPGPFQQLALGMLDAGNGKSE